MSELVDWKAKGWIMVSPDMPDNFAEMPWNELPWSAASTPQVKVYDDNGKQIGAVVAIDTNTNRCWRAPILTSDFPDEKATTSPPRAGVLRTASERLLKAKGKKLVEVVYAQLELGWARPLPLRRPSSASS